MSKKASAGGLVATMCTNCKMELSHTIMAMVGDNIARVKCRTCGSEHNYRDKAKKPAKKTVRTSAKRGAPIKNPEKVWEEAMKDVKGKNIPYDGTRSYRKGELVSHPSFGTGVVISASEKKMSIIFKDKERKLLSAN